MAKGQESIRIYAEISEKDVDFLKAEAQIRGLTVAKVTGEALREWITTRRRLRGIQDGRNIDVE